MAHSVRKSTRETSVKKTIAKKKTGSRKKTSKRKGSLRKDGKLTWIGFVKKYQADHDVSYGEAMAAAKKPWAVYKKQHHIE